MPFDATDFKVPVRLLDHDPKTITDPKERLMYLRDFLRELPEEKFALDWWFSNPEFNGFCWQPERWVGQTCATAIGHCGSAACIAGHALAIFTPDAPVPFQPGHEARLVLGLDLGQSLDLFEPQSDGEQLPQGVWRKDVTTAQAANVLDHLIQTGEVDWSKA